MRFVHVELFSHLVYCCNCHKLCRVRPIGSTGDTSPSCVQIGDAGQLAVYHPENGRRFVYAYDKVFDQQVTQEHVRPTSHPAYKHECVIYLASCSCQCCHACSDTVRVGLPQGACFSMLEWSPLVTNDVVYMLYICIYVVYMLYSV